MDSEDFFKMKEKENHFVIHINTQLRISEILLNGKH